MRTVYSVIFHNFLIKLLALVLAVLVWIYIASQLYKELPERGAASSTTVKLQDRNIMVKRLPIYVNIKGTPAPGYMTVVGKIRIRPSECVVAGPPERVKAIDYVSTALISVSGVSRTIQRKAHLIEPPGCEIGQEQDFKVIIPIIRKGRR